jgi:hypothetical protein
MKLKEIYKLFGRIDMGRMSWIAKLAEEGNLKDLTEEVGSVEVAQGFIDAVTNIRDKKDNPAYNKLNEIQTEMVKDATDKISAASVGIKNEDN